ncbi:MAG: helix-turn-helix transcriptional regulator [Clostridia bacterium]|nr:helix-turn-helix transcriptional regulator [Clostridia bacterium]
MNILIDEQLKKLRKQKGNTQENLANHLGISVQSVSKWERGEGHPDITLLPYIASYYNVSVDELLGVDAIAKEKRFQDYEERHKKLFEEGRTKERVKLWREAEKEFPNDLRVTAELMYALNTEGGNDDKVIEYGERILAESTDAGLRSSAIQVLAFTSHRKGDKEAAKKYADMATSICVSREALFPHILDGEEAVKYCQTNIQEFVGDIGLNTQIMIGKGNYSPEDSNKALEFMINLYNLLYPNGDFGFYHCRVSGDYEQMAKNYLKLQNEEKMFECLEKATEHSIKFDTRGTSLFKYTSFMVNKVEDELSVVKDYTENDTGLLLKLLKSDMFKEYQSHPRMIKIIEKLTPIAII